MALYVDTEETRRLQRGHIVASRLTVRHDGNGSPHRRHNGGLNGRIASQHSGHTGPRDGSFSAFWHAAHEGARTTENRLSAIARSTTPAVRRERG
jgi:hypothetical protein